MPPTQENTPFYLRIASHDAIPETKIHNGAFEISLSNAQAQNLATRKPIWALSMDSVSIPNARVNVYEGANDLLIWESNAPYPNGGSVGGVDDAITNVYFKTTALGGGRLLQTQFGGPMTPADLLSFPETLITGAATAIQKMFRRIWVAQVPDGASDYLAISVTVDVLNGGLFTVSFPRPVNFLPPKITSDPTQSATPSGFNSVLEPLGLTDFVISTPDNAAQKVYTSTFNAWALRTTVPEGQYTSTALAETLTTLLGANYSVSQKDPPTDNRFIIKRFIYTIPMFVYSRSARSTLSKLLGYAIHKPTAIYQTSIPNNLDSDTLAQSTPSLNGDQMFYIHSHELLNKKISVDSEGIPVAMVCAVPVTVPYGQNQTRTWQEHDAPGLVIADPSGSKSMTTISIRLRDTFGQLVDPGSGEVVIVVKLWPRA